MKQISRNVVPHVLVTILLAYCAVPAESTEKGNEGRYLEGIAAIVGDSVILHSELEAYTLLRIDAMEKKPDSTQLESLQKTFLDELIDGKVLLVHVDKDTSIEIRDEEIDDAVERHIRGILQQNNLTLSELEKELHRSQGTSLSQFKKQLRKGIREQLLKQRVQQRFLSATEPSRKEVEAFFNEYKDSLPTAGKSVHLSRLEITVTVADSIRQAAFEKITALREKIESGEDFQELAKQYSDGPNADNGGDLGFIGKGWLSELNVEDAAFALNPGQISDVVESRLGFHLLKCLERREQKVNILQIMVRVTPSEASLQTVRNRLDSIRTSATTDSEFSEAVKLFCTDKALTSRDGSMGWVSFYALPTSLRSKIDSLDNGDITPPMKDGNTFLLYRLNDRREDRAYSLEYDWDRIAEKAREIAAQKKLRDLVSSWREETFIDIRL